MRSSTSSPPFTSNKHINVRPTKSSSSRSSSSTPHLLVQHLAMRFVERFLLEGFGSVVSFVGFCLAVRGRERSSKEKGVGRQRGRRRERGMSDRLGAPRSLPSFPAPPLPLPQSPERTKPLTSQPLPDPKTQPRIPDLILARPAELRILLLLLRCTRIEARAHPASDVQGGDEHLLGLFRGREDVSESLAKGRARVRAGEERGEGEKELKHTWSFLVHTNKFPSNPNSTAFA